MKKYVKQHWFEYAYSAVLILMATIGISLIFGYGFSTNDDVMLRNIVNGNYTGTPDAHLIYIMYPLAFILKCLYTLTDKIAWYDVFMVGMHYVCWFMLLVRLGGCFEKKLNKAVGITLFYVGLLIVDLPYIVMHQYTVLAALLASVTVFWLVASKVEGGKQYWYERGICLVFIVLCMWLRKEVFLLTLPILFLIIVSRLLQARKEKHAKKAFFNNAIFILIFVFAVLGSFLVEKLAYSSPEWKDFLAYNEARTDIYDFYGIPSYYAHEQAYKDLNLDAGDWLSVDAYNTKFVNDISAEKLETLAELAKGEWEEVFRYTSIPRLMIYNVSRELFYNTVQPVGIILTVLYVIALIYCFKADKKKEFISICLILLFEFAVIGYFSWQGRYPERVSYGFYFVQMIYLMAVLLSDIKEKKIFCRKNIFWMVVCSAVLLILFGSVGLYRVRTTLNDKQVLEQNCAKWKEINSYFRENEDKYYCIDTKSFVFASELMFENEEVEATNMIRLGTWVLYSPIDEQHDAGEKDWLAELVDGRGYFVQDEQLGLEQINEILSQKGYSTEAKVVDRIITADGSVYEIISLAE